MAATKEKVSKEIKQAQKAYLKAQTALAIARERVKNASYGLDFAKGELARAGNALKAAGGKPVRPKKPQPGGNGSTGHSNGDHVASE